MRTLFGSILIGCGLLIAGLSGLCLVIIVGGTLAAGSAGEGAMVIPAVLPFAGVPLLAGIGMFVIGRRQIRRADDEAQDRVQSDTFK